MNRADLQWLARERLRDAKRLLTGGRWSGAYYLAGYAVECGLKSAVLAHIERTGIIFLDKKFAEKCWTHNLAELLQLADLKAEFDLAAAVDADLLSSWDTVKDWTELSRYARTRKANARSMYAAVAAKKHGVLSWIKDRW
jgi:HEPN domain-containing protein